MRDRGVRRTTAMMLGLGVMVFLWAPGTSTALATPFAAQQAALYAPTPQTEAHFGQSVAVSGNTIAVGQPDFHSGAPTADLSDAGAVDVYVSSGGEWVLQQQLLLPVYQEATGYGSAVAIDGNVLVIGAPAYATGHGATGAAFVYRRYGTTWTLEKTLVGETITDNERYGAAVAIDGTTIVVGAPNDGHGTVWPYLRTGLDWVSQGTLSEPFGAASDYLGGSVAVEGDTIMAGATGDDWGPMSSIPNVGSVAWFSRTAGVWSYRNTVRPPDPTADSGFGGALAISHSSLLVGAMNKAVNGLSDAGKAYVFVDNGAEWAYETSLTAPTPTSPGYYGSSVALDGPTALVGEFFANGYRGKAYFYTGLSGIWTIRQTIDMEGDSPAVVQLGTSAALSGGTAVLGAQMSGSPTVGLAGAAFVFNTHGVITGVVRDSATGLPIAGIEVSAYPAGQAEPDVLAGLMNTDSHGRYTFSLDGGDYGIGWMDETASYQPGFYNGGHLWPEATTVTVSTGATTTVDLSLKHKPNVTLTMPVTGFTWVTHKHTFTTYGYLKPRHTAGTYPVKLYCYRYQKGATGRYSWVLRKTVSARASDYHPRTGAMYTKYSAKLSLPYTGKWRIRAYHAPDSKYAPTYSGYRYVTVK